MTRKAWGIDSAKKADQELYNCVKKHYGTPAYWGRYLADVPGVSRGLSKLEISFIHSRGIKILPIYNVFDQAIDYDKGAIAVRNAVFHARRLEISAGTVIFANIEHFFTVKAEWISAWAEKMTETGFRPGFYHDPVKGDFSDAYCEAVNKNSRIARESILWSSRPETGAGKEYEAPPFNPSKPPCKGNVWIWQYGRDARLCPIDTNLAESRLMKYLY
ncbi:glycoside hydrolase domain-containing protein [Metabacillus sp. 84]|uniref:glycoside hydrolase domain-containing protein n=1 Tax=unclassified Metabacillus TaxID=2675274 RepID=UPI003CEC57E5